MCWGRGACFNSWGENTGPEKGKDELSTTSVPSTLQAAVSNSAKNTWPQPGLVILLLGWRLPKVGEILADRCQMPAGADRGGTELDHCWIQPL